MSAPKGLYFGEFSALHTRYKATGAFRRPLKGEYFLSGAEITAYRASRITAYRASSDLDQSYWIAKPVELIYCPLCMGSIAKS
jgi:hypothetical protein